MIKDKRLLAKEIIDAFGPKNIEDIEWALKELFSATLEKMFIAKQYTTFFF
ncbi:hypothetical protein [Thermotalea metallivorans]|uniref:hypothetical protein n=1 Tax=Thermotalea metallivorans TaxID=520762 RepID=UPI0012EE1068|nr:hypothetical protein [Thermotalea metallivorans]